MKYFILLDEINVKQEGKKHEFTLTSSATEFPL
jgi:hypothetical protein